MAGLLENLPTPLSSSETSLKERVTYIGAAKDEKESALDTDKSPDGYNDEDEKPLLECRISSPTFLAERTAMRVLGCSA